MPVMRESCSATSHNHCPKTLENFGLVGGGVASVAILTFVLGAILLIA